MTLLAGAIGAFAAIVAQLIGALVHRSTEKRRLKADERTRRMDRCLDVFVEFLETIDEHINRWCPSELEDEGSIPVATDPSEPIRVRKILKKIQLIAPETYPTAAQLFGAYRSLSVVCTEPPGGLSEEFRAATDPDKQALFDQVGIFEHYAREAFRDYFAGHRIKDLKGKDVKKIIEGSRVEEVLDDQDDIPLDEWTGQNYGGNGNDECNKEDE